jgi:hypothetical protein
VDESRFEDLQRRELDYAFALRGDRWQLSPGEERACAEGAIRRLRSELSPDEFAEYRLRSTAAMRVAKSRDHNGKVGPSPFGRKRGPRKSAVTPSM